MAGWLGVWGVRASDGKHDLERRVWDSGFRVQGGCRIWEFPKMENPNIAP